MLGNSDQVVTVTVLATDVLFAVQGKVESLYRAARESVGGRGPAYPLTCTALGASICGVTAVVSRSWNNVDSTADCWTSLLPVQKRLIHTIF